MNDDDALLRLLRDFFGLSPGTVPEQITQEAIPAWDSLAMVQLIADLQGTFGFEFELDELDALKSYHEIRHAIIKRGVSLQTRAA